MRFWCGFNPKRRRRRGAALGILTGLACCLLAGCSGEWEYDPITDVNDLGGRRVGVNLSWEADYVLTGRDDLVLYRYDTVADQVMALNYDKLDALAMDGLMWRVVSCLSSGLDRVEPAFGSTGYTLYFNADNEALQDEFNAFLAEYKQTEEYRDLLEREAGFDGVNYDGPDIPLTGTGRVLRVAIESEGFPRTFREPGEDTPTGFDLEPLKRFANERDYRLEFVMSNYEDGIFGLMSGIYDIQIGYLSDAYSEEVRAAGLYVSDTIDETPLYFVQKSQRDISVQLDELE